MKNMILKTILLALVLTIQLIAVQAQTTEFTYQGNLNNGAAPATGNYDFEFALFSAVTAGSQLGATVTVSNVAVTNGGFSTKIDFGDQFTGPARFLEIRVRQTGGGAFTTLTPRQTVNSAPYSVKSLSADTATTATTATNATNATTAATATNATQLGGVAANQYVVTSDSRMTDARNPLPGNTSYIQNTTTQQSLSNFNISGNGISAGTLSGNIVSANSHFDIGGYRVLSSSTNANLFAGIGAGIANTGIANTFVGVNAGYSNTNGISNTFSGFSTGQTNTTGSFNSFYGESAGKHTTTGQNNSFFGRIAGLNNTTGSGNSFFGRDAGNSNTTGSQNSFLGLRAGFSNLSGNNNSMVGTDADVGSASLTNATAIGSNAYVTQSNSLVLGSIIGVNNAPANTNVGIGTTAPQYRLHVVGERLQLVGENVRVEGNTTSVLPRFSLFYTGGGTDQKKWQNYATTNRLSFTALSDSEGSETAWLHVMRGTGTAISSVVLPNGNVGIGTTTPAAKLDVNGTIQSSSGGFKFPDGSIQNSAQPPITAYTVVGTATVVLPNPTGGEVSILSLNLPAGSYQVLAYVDGKNDDVFSRQTIQCRIGSEFLISAYMSPDTSLTLSSHTIVTLPSQGTITLTCSKVFINPPASIRTRRLSAIRVADTVVVQ